MQRSPSIDATQGRSCPITRHWLQKVADILEADFVDEAIFESNNGARGFMRNVERKLSDRGVRRCVLRDQPQSKNKEARILASSAWVSKHVFMQANWETRFPQFYKQLFAYQKGKNDNDDAPDVRAAIYERVANPSKSIFRVRTA